MDLGFIVFSVFVMTIGPLGDVRCSAGVDCPCPAIPLVNLTQPPQETCFQIDSHFRYDCTKGYVRKGGTSNLIKCQNTGGGVAKWTEATLQCIPDPKIIPTPPIKLDCPCPAIPPMNLTQPPPETCFQIDHRFRYNCTTGYVRKAGTSNLIKCKNTGGVAKWTETTLQCIPDPRIIPTPPPSPPVKQGHTDTDIPPDSTIAITVTAATTSLQMTQSISTSATVTAETYSTEPTSSGLQVLSVHTQAAATTSLQMTQSINTSATVTAETDSTEPTSSGLQGLSVHTQAAATTSLQMTQSINTSASVTAETDSTEPTSSGLQGLSVHTQAGEILTETKTKDGTTPASTTAEPSQRSTVEPLRHGAELTGKIASISIASLVIVCACAGVSFYFYKRRTKYMIPVRTSEEDVPMDDAQSQDRVCSQPATAAESSRLNGNQDSGV